MKLTSEFYAISSTKITHLRDGKCHVVAFKKNLSWHTAGEKTKASVECVETTFVEKKMYEHKRDIIALITFYAMHFKFSVENF